MSENKRFYTKLFEKCNVKPRATGEFEECCKDEMRNVLEKDITKTKSDIFNRVSEIAEKRMNNELDKIEKVI